MLSNRKGFTLIEILVVISIIGLISSVMLVGLSSFRARGRDARRLADLKSLQSGLEIYYTKAGSYPADLATLISAGIGISKLPKDPTTGADYFYSLRTDKQGYILMAALDNKDAADLLYQNSYQGSLAGYSGTVSGCAPASGQYCVQF